MLWNQDSSIPTSEIMMKDFIPWNLFDSQSTTNPFGTGLPSAYGNRQTEYTYLKSIFDFTFKRSWVGKAKMRGYNISLPINDESRGDSIRCPVLLRNVQ